MITVGVDLAAEPRKTAVARIQWDHGAAVLLEVSRGHKDASILNACEGADKVGIDAPFGWPEAFIDFVSDHRYAQLRQPHEVDLTSRRRLANRATDFYVREQCGMQPLSVSSDRIASVAMRCAGIQAQFAAVHGSVDRAGSGRLVEVYPAAALQRWSMNTRGYKGSDGTKALGALMSHMRALAPWLNLGEFEPAMATNDDEFDAVISALVARTACSPGLVDSIPGRHLASAQTEGWIALPRRDSLSQLATA